jgi:hypothetical protein
MDSIIENIKATLPQNEWVDIAAALLKSVTKAAKKSTKGGKKSAASSDSETASTGGEKTKREPTPAMQAYQETLHRIRDQIKVKDADFNLKNAMSVCKILKEGGNWPSPSEAQIQTAYVAWIPLRPVKAEKAEKAGKGEKAVKAVKAEKAEEVEEVAAAAPAKKGSIKKPAAAGAGKKSTVTTENGETILTHSGTRYIMDENYVWLESNSEYKGKFIASEDRIDASVPEPEYEDEE